MLISQIRPRNIKKDTKMEKHLTTCSQKPLPWSVKQLGESIGERHYDVQLIGGIALHEGNIAEMQTGEGKTLASTCPVYLNALTGLGVHVITPNDYLARRDSNWMGQIYRFLGMNTGLIQHGYSDQSRP